MKDQNPVMNVATAVEPSARDICLGEALDRAAIRWPDRAGWIFDEEVVSFSAMKERADQVARSLIAIGVKHGETVATWLPNLPEFAYLQFGCAKIGAILVPINTRSKTFELSHILRSGEVVALFMIEHFLNHDFRYTLNQVMDADAKEPMLSLLTVVSLAERPEGVGIGWKDFLQAGERISSGQLAERQTQVRWTDPAILQFTSGTTATPKGALCNHRYVLYYGENYSRRMGLREGEALLNTQPFYHVGGSCGALPLPLVMGTTTISAEYYEPERIFVLTERHRPTARTGYGAMYIMEMNHPRFAEYDRSSIRSAWCVGTPALLERVRSVMGIEGLVQIYGATEALGTSGSIDEPWEIRSTTCGRVIEGMELGIFEPETNRLLTANEVGEIRLRGWMRFDGYLGQPEKTARTIDSEGWVHTGDLGKLDEGGYLSFVGRLKDMLKIGGENVAAEEVEAVLLSHPGITQAAIIGMPDDRLGEVVLAVVEPRRGAFVEADEVIAFCRARMANFRVPRRVELIKEWPMTESGKIQKNRLRDLYLPADLVQVTATSGRE